MNPRRLSVPRALLLAAPMIPALCASLAAQTQTSQDFTNPGTSYAVSACGTAPAPVVKAGGPTGGNYLQLIGGLDTSSTNTIAFDRTLPGASTTVTVDFDFRITPGTGRGEGFGFALLNTATYGKSGALCGAAEEPNFTGSLGIGFDINKDVPAGDPNSNHVSVHFNGAVVQTYDVTSIVDLASGQWIHAQIVARPGGGFSDVSVFLTPPLGAPTAVVSNLGVTGLNPYEGRAYFGARTSSQTAGHDLANVLVQFTIDKSVLGEWTNPFTMPVVPIHSHLMPTGQVLCWDRAAASTDTRPRLLNPAKNPFVDADYVALAAHPGLELFCSGHTILRDGRLFVAGGHNVSDGNGLNTSFIYDSATDTWTQGPNMNAGRWYPTTCLLSNGDVAVLSGSSTPGNNNTIPQVMQFATNSWRTLTGANRNLNLFPMLHLAPNGKVFMSGPGKSALYLDTAGTGAWITVNDSAFGFRDYGSSVLYDTGKVLLVGGGDPPTKTAELIDLTAGTPLWHSTNSMSYARRQLNAVLLPDGKVLLTGGTSSGGFNDFAGAVQAAELWDPSTEKWTVLAGMHVARLYHSETILLPDGRVLSQGGGHPAATTGGTDNFNSEYYSPPYLFQGPRPTITSLQARAAYGQTFPVGTADAVDLVTMLPLGSVTHAFNQNQRILRPAFAVTGGGINVTAPSDPNLCPPGIYMLFLLKAGVPSVAGRIRIDQNLSPVASAGSNITAEATGPSGAQVSLDGTGSTDPESGIVSYEWYEGATLIATGPNPMVTLGIGVHTITLKVTDSGGLTSTSSVQVTITDSGAPVVSSLTATPDLIRSITNALVAITLNASVTDSDDPSPTASVTLVSSNEAVTGAGPGDQSPDWQTPGGLSLSLRSERFTYVRKYAVTVQAADASGNTSAPKTVQVRVRGKWLP